MTRFVAVLILLGTALGLDWQNTGELAKARDVRDLTYGPAEYLYAAACIDTSSLDSGWVFVSEDLVNWERAGDLPGDVRMITSLLGIGGDTLYAGTRSVYSGADSGHFYFSADRGDSWVMRSRLRGTRVGYTITALYEDRSGRFYAGHNYLAMHTSGAPCFSTDRGVSWFQGTTTARCPYQYCLLEDAAGNMYCGAWGTGGLVMKSNDSGVNWSATGTLFDAGHATAVIEGPTGVVFAGTYPKTAPQEPIGRVFRTTNAGGSWEEVGYGYFNGTTGIRSLCWTGDGRLFAGSVPNGEVFGSEDTGATWTSTGMLPGADIVFRLLEVRSGDTTFLYAATGPNGDVFRADISGVVGTAEEQRFRADRLLVLPNPCLGVLEVRVGRRVRVGLVNCAGARVRTFRFDRGTNRLDLGGLAPGFYLLKPSGSEVRPAGIVVTRH